MSCCSYFDHTAETKGKEERSRSIKTFIERSSSERWPRGETRSVLVPERRLRLTLPSRTLVPQGGLCLVGAGRSAEAEFELSVGARERSASRVPAGRLSTLFSSCRTQNVHIARCTARFTGSVSSRELRTISVTFAESTACCEPGGRGARSLRGHKSLSREESSFETN